MKKQSYLYILSNGKVAAINKKDGSIVWEVSLKAHITTGMSHSIGQITIEDDKLFIGANGALVCLSAKDGAFIWKNELKGWGYNFVSIANAGTEAAAGAAAVQAAAGNAAVIAAAT